MAKKVKCKKCRLEYDKKKYECPYCHKKRFNPTGLIITIIALIIGGGILFYFKGNEILNAVKEMKNVTVFENGNVEYKITNMKKESVSDNVYITFTIEVENKNNTKEALKCILSAYADDYLVKDCDSYTLYEELQKGTKLKRDYKITVKKEWNEITIYGEIDGEDYKMFTIYNVEENDI